MPFRGPHFQFSEIAAVYVRAPVFGNASRINKQPSLLTPYPGHPAMTVAMSVAEHLCSCYIRVHGGGSHIGLQHDVPFAWTSRQAADCVVWRFCRGARRSLFIRRLLLVGGFGCSRCSYPGCFRCFGLVGFLGGCHLLRRGILLCRWNAGRLIRLHVLCRGSAGTQQQYRRRG